MKLDNVILSCDSYKLHHFAEYPSATSFIYSTVVPRKAMKGYEKHGIIAAGGHAVAKYLSDVRVTAQHIEEAQAIVKGMGYDFNREGWEIIVSEFGGRLPLAVYGVKEGSLVAPNTPILSVVNTDSRFAWLVSYMETVIQRIMWKMSTVATTTKIAYNMIGKYQQKTGEADFLLPFKLHNFGDRGADSQEAAAYAGLAHAMFFDGSDSCVTNLAIREIFGDTKPFVSSVDATEHSVMCSHSDAENKDDYNAAVMAVDRLYEAVARASRGVGIPLQSVVIDTYDDERFVCEYIGQRLRDRVINSGGTLVLRPDSGDPLSRPIQVMEWLGDAFGYTINSKGYKVLHPSVRVIQGDGINLDSIQQILINMERAGWSIDNLVFGMGGALTHGGSRDVLSFSMKATAINMHGSEQWISLQKAPKTDSGKVSLKGLAYKSQTMGKVCVADKLSKVQKDSEQFYFCDGFRKTVDSFENVRERARELHIWIDE